MLILLMILVTILDGFGLLRLGFEPLWIAGVSAWASAMLLFTDTSRILKIQVSLILVAGGAMILYAHTHGVEIDPGRFVNANTGLMTMIAAVGFLRLVVIPDTLQEESLPVGRKAFLQTLIGLNISSSIINISAPILISDRIHRKRPDDRLRHRNGHGAAVVLYGDRPVGFLQHDVLEALLSLAMDLDGRSFFF